MRHFWVLFGLMVVLAMPARAQHLHLVTEEQPPMNYRDASSGKVVGISTELVSAIAMRAGVSIDIALLPWNRAYRQAQQDASTCIFTTVRTPEREKLFKWVGPLFKSGWAFYKVPGHEIEMHSIADIKDYVVTATTETLAISGVPDLPGVQVIETANDRQALALVYEGRADLWVSGVFTAYKVSGLEGRPVPELAFLWHEMELGLACNLAVDDAVIARLNAANIDLDGLREELKARHYYYSVKPD